MPKISSSGVPDTIILAGGKGTRLAREIPGTAKVLAPVGGKPFIDHVIEYLSSIGIRHMVLSLGYLSEQIVDHIQKSKFRDISFDFATETQPLGTGGGIRYALDQTKTDPVLILNGDTYCQFSLQKFLDFHQAKKAKVCLLASKVPDPSRFGTLEISSDEQVLSFFEKHTSSHGAYVNSGVYLVARDTFSQIQKNKAFSFEREILPRLCGNGLYAYVGGNYFIDMGTTESYRNANEFFSQKLGKTL